MFHFKDISTSLKLGQLSEIRRKIPICSFSLERKEKIGMFVQCFSFSGICTMEWFLSHLTQSTDRANLLWLAVGRRQEESLVSCCSNRVLHTMFIQKLAQLDVIRRKHPVCGFYFGREREASNVCLIFQIFKDIF